MALSEKEIDLLIKKLREKYRKNAMKYNTSHFNIEAFEDRLQMALRNKMNLEGFLLAEVSNFEELKGKIEKKEPEKPFTLHVNKIIEENIERIKKYKEIKFHPLASLEISHFYGALSEFALNYFVILWSVISDAEQKNILNEFDEALSFLAIPRGNKHPKRIEDHALILSRKERREIEIEKDKNEYLKVSAFLLHEIIRFADKQLDARNVEWETPLRFDKLYVEGQRKGIIINIFSGMTGYGAILMVKERASQIINDFRLDAFKRKNTDLF